MKKIILLYASAAFLFISCEKSQHTSDLGAGGASPPIDQYDETEMNAAIATARQKIEEFKSVLAANEGEMFAVKAPVEENGSTEHFWLSEVTFSNGAFTGKINNEPGIVGNVKLGDPWTVKEADISDWMFTRGEMIHGGFTIEPLLKSMPEEQAEELRAKLVR